MICTATKKDGTPCKATAKADGLCVAHMSKETPSVAETVGVPQGEPAVFKGLPRSRNPRFGQRRVKMLRPICSDGCGVTWDWYTKCPHDPYVGIGEKRVTTPIYSEPLEDGSVIVVSAPDEFVGSSLARIDTR